MSAAAGLELGVERSVTGRRWRPRPLDARAALAISQRLGLPEVLGRVLAARLAGGPEEVAAYLSPRLRDALPEPSRLRDLDGAAARLADAVVAGERVGLLADYDVDGATSAALLARYLRAVGAAGSIEVPDRLAEGYGPNPAAFARLKARGCRLVVTLDCGTTAFEPLAAAAADGIGVIVVDHHAAEPRLPEALAVVNPNRLDQDAGGGGCGHLAAVGVTFLLAVGLNRELRRRGHFGGARPEPDLLRWLDLVALGTVADVVPLTGLNRAFVAQGLRVAADWANPGLRALAAAAGLRAGVPVRADDFGFVLGPRLNAGSRLGRSDLAARLLAGDDPAEAAAIAEVLDRCNGERRALERRALAGAGAAVAGELERGDAPLLVAAGEGWSPGVVGLVASRLVERYHRPAVVIALAGDGVGRGSGRSVPGLDLGAAVIAARQAGVLLQGGGHPMAAGLTVAAGRVGELRAFLTERLRGAPGGGAAGPGPAELELDGALSPTAATAELAELLERLAPYGPGNPEPRFMLTAVRPVQARRAGDGHVACRLVGPTGGGGLKAIAFRCLDTPLGAALLDGSGAPLHVAGRVRLDAWQGRRGVALHVEDAARS
ncbi:MAG TPA: single-stranded-DNA-specific exonuclease RecJ [Geminicoccaceae bacterium]|nr:single-stranded-DNA-specific exonuclease RecJ [Geminicoccaceae bacterium]